MSIKSELAKTASYLRSTRKAILGRGGEISATAGMKDLPEAIFNIPADTSLAFYEDSDVAYEKRVTANAEEYAMIKQIGGASYKSENLFDDTVLADIGMEKVGEHEYYAKKSSDYAGKIIFTNTERLTGSFLIEAELLYENADEAGLYVTVYYEDGEEEELSPWYGEFDEWFEYWEYTSGNVERIEFSADDYSAQTTIKNLQIRYAGDKYGLDDEGVYKPYFDGFRHTKVTSLTSEGANLIPFPYYDTSKTEKGVTYTVNTDGTITISGTATDYSQFLIHSFEVNPDITYTFTFSGLSSDSKNILLVVNLMYESSVITSLTANTEKGITFNTTGWAAAINRVTLAIKRNNNTTTSGTVLPMLNYGNEAAPYKPYKEGAIDTLTIPEAVQKLDGYGVGMDATNCNYIEFVDGKVLYHKVCETVTYDGSIDEAWNFVSGRTYAHIAVDKKGHRTAPLSASKSNIKVTWLNLNNPVNIQYGYDGTRIPSELKTLAEFRAWMGENPLHIVYVLDTPEVTDITHLFTRDNFMEVEGCGAITAVNEDKKAVPTTVKYTRKTEV